MKRKAMVLAVLAMSATLQAATIDVPMNKVSKTGIDEAIGTITIDETEYGLRFTPNLKALPAGIHGFHLHENGSCEPADKDGQPGAALAAGGHFDPEKTGKHLGPYDKGHLGDLPAIYVTPEGTATYPVLAPRLKNLKQIEGLSLMIHAGSDNHSDSPQPLGGGGDRMACGIIK